MYACIYVLCMHVYMYSICKFYEAAFHFLYTTLAFSNAYKFNSSVLCAVQVSTKGAGDREVVITDAALHQ